MFLVEICIGYADLNRRTRKLFVRVLLLNILNLYSTNLKSTPSQPADLPSLSTIA